MFWFWTVTSSFAFSLLLLLSVTPQEPRSWRLSTLASLTLVILYGGLLFLLDSTERFGIGLSVGIACTIGSVVLLPVVLGRLLSSHRKG